MATSSADARAASSNTSEPPRFTWNDAAMTLLALASVVIVLLDIFARRSLYDWGIFSATVFVDLVITLIFLGEFVYKSSEEGLLQHARNSWFDLLGMVPMIAFVLLEASFAGVSASQAVSGDVRLLAGGAAGGALRLFRFARIVRIFTAWSRFLRATNMTFGEQVTKRFFDKYRRIVVAELTTPILLAGITVSQEIIIRMKFLDSAGRALDLKRDEIHAAVVEALKNNNVPDAVITAPLVERIVASVEQAVVDTVVDTLTGPELNKLTQELIVEILTNFKEQLSSEEGKKALLGLSK